MPAHAATKKDSHAYSYTMKRPLFHLLAALLTLSCSVESLLLGPGSTPTPAATATNTLTPIPSATPVTPTLTFTLTPTLSGIKPPSPTLEDTATPVVSVTPFDLLPLASATATVQMDGFVSVQLSRDSFYKGKICEPSTIRITAQVVDAKDVKYVLLFVRFKSMRAERAGKWTKIDMQTVSPGTYIHDLSSDQILEDAFFQTAWVEYQLVATLASGREVGRTGIFKEKLAMLECAPTPTPTPGTVKP
jgi:hypothetical protein